MAKSKKRAIPAKQGTKRGRTAPAKAKRAEPEAPKDQYAARAESNQNAVPPETPPPWASQ